MQIKVAEQVEKNCRRDPERAKWLRDLPSTIQELQARWDIALGEPFIGEEVSCAWVGRVTRRDGSSAVLKLGMPHMEGRDEIPGLKFWDGEPTVKLLESDESANAMLLEACIPGTPLRALPESEQDIVIAGLLRRLWRTPPLGHGFRPLSDMAAYWAAESEAASLRWPDSGLVQEGLRLLRDLPKSASESVLLATDLHAGNVLKAERNPPAPSDRWRSREPPAPSDRWRSREPWLVIDPKPFVGDPAYDATQHLFNCEERMTRDPFGTIRRFSDLLQIDSERVRLWTFARSAAECRDDWSNESMSLARELAP